MAHTKLSTTEKARLQGVWRAAAQRPDGLDVPLPTLAAARNMRFALYNAVRAERNDPFLADALLADALENIQLSVREDPPRVELRRKAIVGILEALATAVPELDALSKDSMELRAAESQARLEARLNALAELKTPPDPHSPLLTALRGPGPTGPTGEGAQPSPPTAATQPTSPLGAPNPFYTRDPKRPGASS